MIDSIRAREPDAAFRSSFIVGFPGEVEADHDVLLSFLEDAHLDWAGFFPFSREDGTPAAAMSDRVEAALINERLRECAEVQEPITAAARAALLGRDVDVLVDGLDDDDTLVGRTYREAPEIDGVVHLPEADVFARPGAIVRATVCGVEGPDLEAKVST